MKYYFLSPILLISAITSCSEEFDYAKYPNVGKCREIQKAFVQSEVSLYDAAILKARIEKQQAQFEESERGRCSAKMKYFTVDIERTFPEHSQEPLAKLTIDAVKDYERNRGCYWSLLYQWNANPDGTCSLWCLAQVDPDEFETALAQKEKI